MFSSKRISCLAGAMLLGVLPQAAAAQSAQVAAQGTGSYSTSSDSGIGAYERSHALVIGINSYAGQWQPRASAIHDAQEVTASLKSLGFTVEQVLDPNRRKLDSSFERFLRGPGSSPNSRLVIWFSGQAVTQDGRAHLLTMSRQGDRGLSDLSSNSVSLDRLSRYLRDARAKHVLSAFDACFSHSGFKMANSAPLQSITRQIDEPVRQIITSCDANQVVSDNGKFRRLFLDALTGRARIANVNKDAYLTGTELGLFLTDRLSSLTENLQTPTFGKMRYAGLDRGDIVFRIPSTPLRIEPKPLPGHASQSPRHEPAAREPESRLAEKIQRRLNHLGCYSGKIDGYWGRGTKQAIKQVTFRRRLRPALVNTQPDQETLDRLRSLSGRVCPVVARLPKKSHRVKPKTYKSKTTKPKWKSRRTSKKRKSKSKGKPAYDPQAVFKRMQEEGPG